MPSGDTISILTIPLSRAASSSRATLKRLMPSEVARSTLDSPSMRVAPSDGRSEDGLRGTEELQARSHILSGRAVWMRRDLLTT